MYLWLNSLIINAILLLAYWRGAQPEKQVSIVFFIGFYVGYAVRFIRGRPDFVFLDYGLFFVDAVLLAIFISVALRANRWWPIWVASLQIIPVTGHFIKLLDIDGLSVVYWGMLDIPDYSQIVVILMGIHTHQKRLKKIGAYPDWSY